MTRYITVSLTTLTVLILLLTSLSFLLGTRLTFATSKGNDSDIANIKYCHQVYQGDIPFWLRPYVPDPNGTYRIWICRVA